MPRIPTAFIPEVMPQAGPAPQASAEAFGGGIARGLQGLGDQVSRSADVMAEHVLRFQREQNENAAFELESKFSMEAAELETQYMMLEGNQQAAAYGDFAQNVQGLRDKYLQTAPNDYTKRLVERSTAARFENILTGASRSAALKNREYLDQSAASRIEWNAQDIVNGDEERVGIAIGTIERDVEYRGRINGWDPTKVALEKRDAVSGAITNRALMLARTDPFAARDLMTKMGSEMLPQHRLQLDGAIRNEIATTQVKKDQDAFVMGQNPSINGNFKEVLGARESAGSGGYAAVNTLGYVGKYQFGTARAKDIGIYSANDGNRWKGTFSVPGHPEVKTLQDFLANPAAQEVAFDLHDKKMEQEIRANGFAKYEGQVVDGVQVTRNGIKAALHLGGVGGTKKFLEGRGSEEDKYGTGVKEYMKLGGGASSEVLPAVNAETTDEEFAQVIEAARKRARTVAPGIPEYEERLVAGLETDRAVFQKKAQEEVAQKYDGLGKLILNGGLTEIPPEHMGVYNDLPLDKQRTLQGLVKRNATPGADRETPEQRDNYFRLLAERAQGTLTTDKVLKTDIHGPRQVELMEQLTKPPSTSGGAEMDNTEALGDITFITDPIFGRGEKKDDERYQLFAGQYLARLQQIAAQTGKAPDDVTKVRVATELVKTVATIRPRGGGPLSGPLTTVFGNAVDRRRAYEPPEEQLDIIREEYPELNEEEVLEMWTQEMAP